MRVAEGIRNGVPVRKSVQEANQPILRRQLRMDTIKIKIEGYDFEEVASQLVQLSEKHKAVMIQVNPPSNKFGGFALEPAMIMATGVDALAIVLNFLVIYIHGKLLKGFTDGLTKNKAEVTPEHTGKIIIYAPSGLTESAE